MKLIQALWSEDRLSFEGAFYRTQKATIYDRPATPVPIYVAGSGPVIAKYAGQVGDGFICTSGKAWELYRDSLLPNVAAGLAGIASACLNHAAMSWSVSSPRGRPYRPRPPPGSSRAS